MQLSVLNSETVQFGKFPDFRRNARKGKTHYQGKHIFDDRHSDFSDEIQSSERRTTVDAARSTRFFLKSVSKCALTLAQSEGSSPRKGVLLKVDAIGFTAIDNHQAAHQSVYPPEPLSANLPRQCSKLIKCKWAFDSGVPSSLLGSRLGISQLQTHGILWVTTQDLPDPESAIPSFKSSEAPLGNSSLAHNRGPHHFLMSEDVYRNLLLNIKQMDMFLCIVECATYFHL